MESADSGAGRKESGSGGGEEETEPLFEPFAAEARKGLCGATFHSNHEARLCFQLYTSTSTRHALVGSLLLHVEDGCGYVSMVMMCSTRKRWIVLFRSLFPLLLLLSLAHGDPIDRRRR